MDVGILYSGGKDSNYAVKHALDKGWNISYLLSVKPTRTDCFLFHFATVEHTKLQADALGFKHHLITCDVADPKQEAEIVREFVAANEKIDALILGGTGLQATQIKSIQEALKPHGIEVFAAHSGEDHFELLKQMINDGFEIMITQIASDGLSDWLGKTITRKNLAELYTASVKYGFHVGGEGGYYDSYVVDGPTFSKKIVIEEAEKVVEDIYTGHILITKARLAAKAEQKIST